MTETQYQNSTSEAAAGLHEVEKRASPRTLVIVAIVSSDSQAEVRERYSWYSAYRAVTSLLFLLDVAVAILEIIFWYVLQRCTERQFHSDLMATLRDDPNSHYYQSSLGDTET